MIILPLDPHLVDAAVEFVDLGYLQLLIMLFKLTTVTNPLSPPPPYSAALEFDANFMISVFTKLNQILNIFRGCRPLLVRM